MTQSNSSILDAIRLRGTNDYQQRIPAASQQGVERVFRALSSPMNGQYYNEFVMNLVNLIGTQIVRSREWVNPLAKFKRAPINNMQAIQEIGFELIKAKGFDRDNNEIFDQNDPKIKAAYHTMNRQDKYMITMNPLMLEQAFLTPNGLSNFMAGVMQVPINSDNYDEFNIMKSLIAKYATEADLGFFNVQVPALDDNATEADIKQFIEKIRAYTGQLQFLKTAYNPYHIPTFTMPENTILLMTPEVVAKVDVNVLAAAFNVSFAEMQNKVILIDEMPIEGCYAILADEEWFVCGDTTYQTTSFYNPATLDTNYWLHHWSVLSVSPFMNAIMFSTAAATGLTEIVVTPTTYSVIATDVDGVDTTEEISLTEDTFLEGVLEWTVVPANGNVTPEFIPSTYVINSITRTVNALPVIIPLNSRTYVDRLNKIHLQAAIAVGDVISITATSTYNSDGVGVGADVTDTGDFTVVA